MSEKNLNGVTIGRDRMVQLLAAKWRKKRIFSGERNQQIRGKPFFLYQSRGKRLVGSDKQKFFESLVE